ncbi:MAG: alpha/beta fold hydrolase [Acidimicrobiales bacterium]
MQHVELNGLRIAYREAGPARWPVLAILHGGCDDSRSWRWQLDDLSDSYRVLAWDAPGCGRSDDPPESWRMAEFADAAAGWLAAIGVERAHVLGLSWGSSVALAVADRHPSLVSSLILASAYAGWAGSLPAEEVEARLAGVIEWASAGPGQPAGWPGLFGPPPPAELTRELSVVWADNDPSRRPQPSITMARSMAEADLRPVLPRVRVPVLLLYGEGDGRSPLAVGRALHAAVPGATMSVIPGAGHVCNAEAPDEFNLRVRAFLETAGP